jgi:hypothetical protein
MQGGQFGYTFQLLNNLIGFFLVKWNQFGENISLDSGSNGD